MKRVFPDGQRDLVQMEITKLILHLEVSLSRTLQYIQGFSATALELFKRSQPGSVRMEDFQAVVASIRNSIHSLQSNMCLQYLHHISCAAL